MLFSGLRTYLTLLSHAYSRFQLTICPRINYYYFLILISETPTKKISLDLLEEDDAKLSPFCRYLNRINRIEDEATIISDDDESEYHARIRPRIEYPFWNRLKETIFV